MRRSQPSGLGHRRLSLSEGDANSRGSFREFCERNDVNLWRSLALFPKDVPVVLRSLLIALSVSVVATAALALPRADRVVPPPDPAPDVPSPILVCPDCGLTVSAPSGVVASFSLGGTAGDYLGRAPWAQDTNLSAWVSATYRDANNVIVSQRRWTFPSASTYLTGTARFHTPQTSLSSALASPRTGGELPTDARLWRATSGARVVAHVHVDFRTPAGAPATSDYDLKVW